MSFDRNNFKKMMVAFFPEQEHEFDQLVAKSEVFDAIINELPAIEPHHSLGNLSLSEKDINIILDVLRALDLRGSLQLAVIKYRQRNEEVEDEARKTDMIYFLQEVGILPAIQYIICDSLQTGGGSGRERTRDVSTVEKLSELITNAGLEWNDFFERANPKCILYKTVLEMAEILGNPKVLSSMAHERKVANEKEGVEWLCDRLEKISTEYTKCHKPRSLRGIFGFAPVHTEVIRRLIDAIDKKNTFATLQNVVVEEYKKIRQENPSGSSQFVLHMNKNKNYYHCLRMLALTLSDLCKKFPDLCTDKVLALRNEVTQVESGNYDFSAAPRMNY